MTCSNDKVRRFQAPLKPAAGNRFEQWYRIYLLALILINQQRIKIAQSTANNFTIERFQTTPLD
jgi:hypothetical protein